MLLKSILSKVVFTCIELMSIVPVFQSIFGLYCFSHRSSKIIFSFSSPVARNLVLIFFFSICILSHMQCSIVPVLFFVLFILKAWISFSIGIRAILFCWVNFLSMKVSPAPESIRVFISNLLSVFLPSSDTNKGTLNDFLLVSATSTREIEIIMRMVADIETGCFFKNPILWGNLSIFSFLLWTSFHKSSWYERMLHQLSLKQWSKMLVLEVSVVMHIVFWMQEMVQILLVHDHLLYALVSGIQRKGPSFYSWFILGWTICPRPLHRGLWWVVYIREGDWGGAVSFSSCHFLLSIYWQSLFLSSIGCLFSRLWCTSLESLSGDSRSSESCGGEEYSALNHSTNGLSCMTLLLAV